MTDFVTRVPDRYLPAGTKVRLGGHDIGVPGYEPGEPEYGVVVQCWPSDELLGLHDCYVAFFGNAFPAGKPTEKPYVLRYAVVSLDVVDDEES